VINTDTTGRSVKLETVVRVHRTELGVSTVWTLDRFRDKLAVMRQLYEKSQDTSEDADSDAADAVFNDPNDAWVADSPSSSSLSQSPQLLSPHLYVLFFIASDPIRS